MPVITRATGIHVTLPPGFQLARKGPRELRRKRDGALRRLDAGPSAVRGEGDALIAVLEGQELGLFDALTITPTAVPDVTGRARRAGAEPGITIDVPLAPGQDAVVLVERDGLFEWTFERETGADKGPRRGPRDAATFEIASSAAVPPDTLSLRSPFKQFAVGKLTAYVFRFISRMAGRYAMSYLERNVRTGLVRIGGPDLATWVPLDGQPRMPRRDRRARVLLLVHGTFSSTAGSFGALCGSEWGRTLLADMQRSYDLMLGFDHATLSVDPLKNASDLLAALRSRFPEAPDLDVVAYSRGGLVFRSMVEQLLTAEPWPLTVGRVAFVACTNGGTQLAEPSNWHAFVNRYTNVALATTRALALIPGAAAASRVLGGLIVGLGALVKFLATQAVKEGAVPGLAAMEPEGEFVKILNEIQVGQPRIEDTYYCAVTSDFEPRMALKGVSELPPLLLKGIADAAADRLMGGPNDLVVDTAAMTKIDPAAGDYIKERLDFGTNGRVYHTNYFLQPDVGDALRRWLRVPTTPARQPTRRAGSKGRPAKKTASRKRAPRRTPPAPRPPTATLPPVGVTQNIVVAPGDAPTERVLDQVRALDPDYLVIEIDEGHVRSAHAYRPSELGEFLDRDDVGGESIAKAMDIETDAASVTREAFEEVPPMRTPPGRMPSAGRTVVLSAGEPIGVRGSTEDAPDVLDLAGLGRVARPGKRDRGGLRSGGVRKRPPSPARRRAAAHAPRHTAAVAAAAPARVECNVLAEVADEVELEKIATVQVTVAREQLTAALGMVSAGGRGTPDPKRKIVLQVIPKAEFEVVGDDRAEISVPKPSQPVVVAFDVKPLNVGKGTIWVLVRQGPLPLFPPLKLEVAIVRHRKGAPRLQAAAGAVTAFPAPRPEGNTLRIVETEAGGHARYHYTLELPQLRERRTFQSELLHAEREAFVAALYEGIENSWAANRDQADAFERDLKAVGAKLFEELFPAEMQGLLWTHRDAITTVQVLSTEPHIPWEITYVRKPGGRGMSAGGKFLADLGLVRWLYDGYPPLELRLRSGRVRYVIPEYPPGSLNPLPGAAEEATFLRNELGATPVEPTSKAVYELVESPGRLDALHFACHGAAESGRIMDASLYMRGTVDRGTYVEDRVKAPTIEQYGNLGTNGDGPIVVLNACQAGRLGQTLTGMGGFAHAFVRAGAGAFVGTLWSVGDGSARDFMEKFYADLMDGKSLADATRAARAAAHSAGDPTWLAYTVYGEPRAQVAT